MNKKFYTQKRLLILSLVCCLHLGFWFTSLKPRKYKSKTHTQLYSACPGRAVVWQPRALATTVLSLITDVIGPYVLVWRTSGMEKLLQLRSVSHQHNLMWNFHPGVSGHVGHHEGGEALEQLPRDAVDAPSQNYWRPGGMGLWGAGLVDGVLAHSWRAGTRWSLRSFPTQTIQWF